MSKCKESKENILRKINTQVKQIYLKYDIFFSTVLKYFVLLRLPAIIWNSPELCRCILMRDGMWKRVSLIFARVNFDLCAVWMWNKKKIIKKKEEEEREKYSSRCVFGSEEPNRSWKVLTCNIWPVITDLWPDKSVLTQSAPVADLLFFFFFFPQDRG